MNDDSLDNVERQLTAVALVGAPPRLRDAVLGDVQRALRAARWDRRLARAAAGLLVVGLALNVGVAMQATGTRGGSAQRVSQSEDRQSLVNTAVVVAEATDAATGRQFARQLAVMRGRELTPADSAAIDAAVHNAGNGNQG